MADEVDSIDAKGESENAYLLGGDFGELGHSSGSSNGKETLEAGKEKDSSPDQDDKEGSKETGEDKDKEKDKELKGEEDRFDKHPRWQEMRSELQTEKDARTKAEARLSALEAQLVEFSRTKPGQKESQESLPYQDVSLMEDEKLVDWFSEKPKEFMANLFQQVLHEVKGVLSEETKLERSKNSMESTYAQFEKDHADFKGMVESGAIKKYMDTHLGHNPMSAYYGLTAEKSKQEIQEQINKAKEEGKQETLKQLRAKGNAATLGSGPSAPQKLHTETDELKDTKNKGGLVSVLTDMLHRDRKALNG